MWMANVELNLRDGWSCRWFHTSVNPALVRTIKLWWEHGSPLRLQILTQDLIDKDQPNRYPTQIIHVSFLSVLPIFLANQIAVFKKNKKNTCISWRQLRYLCMEIQCRLSKNWSDTKMLQVHFFSFFTIRTPRDLASISILIVTKLTNIL